MKLLKGLTSVLLSLAILFALVPAFSVSAEADPYYGKTILSKMNNSAALINAYNKLYEGAKELKKEISLVHDSYKINAAELKTVYDVVMDDHPEFFYLDGAYGYSFYPTADAQEITVVKPVYTMTDSQITSARGQLKKITGSLTSGLSGKSEYEISLALHDRVAKTVDYVFSDNDQNVYGALVEGKAVCAGYARAYQLLMQLMGITCWSVEGTSDNPATGNAEAHQWNLSKIDGKWYYTDVTWDDQDEELYYAYFNVTYDVLKGDHRDLLFYPHLPSANSTEANYFYKNELAFNSFDANRLATLLKNGKNTAQIYVRGSVDTFRAEFSKQINTVFGAMGAAPGSTGSFSYSRLGGALIIKVTIVEKNHKHSLKSVPAVKASCSSKGNIAYYTCSCGKWFSDAEGKNEIIDHESVKISALDHTPSGYKSGAADHYKECTACGAVIVGSSKPHSDANLDGSCDVCAAKVKTPEKEETRPEPEPEPESKPDDSSEDGGKDGSGDADDPVTDIWGEELNDLLQGEDGNETLAFLSFLGENATPILIGTGVAALLIIAAVILIAVFVLKRK